jgi:hypothetical protein
MHVIAVERQAAESGLARNNEKRKQSKKISKCRMV